MNRSHHTLRIGGIALRFDGCEPAALIGPFADFAARAQTPEVRLDVRAGRPQMRPGTAIVEAGTWSLFPLETGWRVEFYRRPGGVAQVLMTAEVSRDWKQGAVIVDADLLPPATAAAPVMSPLGELIVMSRLVNRGLYVHASAALWEDGVDLFLGPSGAGKTTLADLAVAHGATVLSDDRTVLRFERGTLVAYGTPFHGKGRHWSSRRGRVRGLFFLEHAAETSFVPMERTSAAAHLAAVTFTQHWERSALERTLQLCDLAVLSAPAHQLRFRPDVSAIDAIASAARPL